MQIPRRIVAIIAILALPAAWFWSLSADPELLHTNLIRTLGGVAGAVASRIRAVRQGGGAPWTGYLAGGVAGSLLVSALSLPFPVLGRVTAAGWLTSGVVGGGLVGLAAYAVLGPRTAAGHPRS